MRRSTKRKQGSKYNQRMLIIILVVLLLVILAGWEGIHYLLESDFDPDNPPQGVDVSSYQLDIDWDQLEKEGYAFAYIKATEGSSHVDSRFAYNWKMAHRTDLVPGAYHFLSFDTDGDTQAENFIRTVNKKMGMLPPAVDIEMYGDYESAPPSEESVNRILKDFLNIVEKKYHRHAVLYTNSYLYKKYLAGKYKENPIWISDPDVNETLPDGRKWTFCQYSFEGTTEAAAGGSKHIDLNYFNGSLWNLRHLK